MSGARSLRFRVTRKGKVSESIEEGPGVESRGVKGVTTPIVRTLLLTAKVPLLIRSRLITEHPQGRLMSASA